MVHEIRRKDRALAESEAYDILSRGGDGVMATLGEDGYPYAVPMNHVLVDRAMYLHCAQVGHKMENIEFCDKVSYCVVTEREVLPAQLTIHYESAVAFGRASVVTDPGEKRRALVALLHRFCPGHLERGMESVNRSSDKLAVLRIDIEWATAKAHRPGT